MFNSPFSAFVQTTVHQILSLIRRCLGGENNANGDKFIGHACQKFIVDDNRFTSTSWSNSKDLFIIGDKFSKDVGKADSINGRDKDVCEVGSFGNMVFVNFGQPIDLYYSLRNRNAIIT